MHIRSAKENYFKFGKYKEQFSENDFSPLTNDKINTTANDMIHFSDLNETIN